ncbi:MAG TPA: hypothetical protein VED84_00025 [Acidimicrobiales bacterium]|nr:hypothetical protein [Acidimicrobiales bacterium]
MRRVGFRLDDDGVELGEVEGVDASVTPVLVGFGRQDRTRESLGSRAPEAA